MHCGMVPRVTRRRAVQAGCTAALAALAGCFGGDNNSDDGSENNTGGPDDRSQNNGNKNNGGENGEAAVRPYTEYVATDEAGAATAIYQDSVAIEAVSDDFDNLVSDSEDPLLLLAAQGANALIDSSLTLEGLGLGELLDSGETALDSDIEALALASQAFVAMGSVQTAEVESTLRSAAGQLGMFEQTAERGPHTFYQPASGGTTTVAVSPRDILVAASPDPIERATAAARGDRPRARETVEEFGWVLDAVDDPDVAFAGHGDPSEGDTGNTTGVLSGTSSFITTHTFGNNSLTADVAAVYPSAGALDDAADSLEARLGSEADDVGFEFDTDRVSVTGTYQVSEGTDGG